MFFFFFFFFCFLYFLFLYFFFFFFQAEDGIRDRDVTGFSVCSSDLADYLLAWLEQLGIERAVLVGHDLGGGVAQIAAVRAPARCAGLVLANSISYDSWPIPSVRALRAVGPLPMSAFKALMGALMARGHDDT